MSIEIINIKEVCDHEEANQCLYQDVLDFCRKFTYKFNRAKWLAESKKRDEESQYVVSPFNDDLIVCGDGQEQRVIGFRGKMNFMDLDLLVQSEGKLSDLDTIAVLKPFFNYARAQDIPQLNVSYENIAEEGEQSQDYVFGLIQANKRSIAVAAWNNHPLTDSFFRGIINRKEEMISDLFAQLFMGYMDSRLKRTPYLRSQAIKDSLGRDIRNALVDLFPQTEKVKDYVDDNVLEVFPELEPYLY